MDSQSIVNWYQRQTVFVSGGSGFLGKALLFKLLLCGTPRIYVLIRPKKGQSPEERLDAILKEEVSFYIMLTLVLTGFEPQRDWETTLLLLL